MLYYSLLRYFIIQLQKNCSFINYNITEKEHLYAKSVFEFYNRHETVVFHLYTIDITIALGIELDIDTI